MYALKHISMTDAIPVIPELEEAPKGKGKTSSQTSHFFWGSSH